MKTCSKCHQEFPATLEYFYKKLDSISSTCKQCGAERSRQWRKENPDKLKKQGQEWRKKNLSRYNLNKKKWRQKNPEAHKKSRDNWYKNNKNKRTEYNNRRRANKLNNGWEKYTEQDMFNKYGTDCYLCQQPIDLNISRTEPEGLNIEHVIPIAKGGPDTLENVRPSHRKCNQSKHDKDLEEFLRHRETVKG
jgi:hypothetical protein